MKKKIRKLTFLTIFYLLMAIFSLYFPKAEEIKARTETFDFTYFDEDGVKQKIQIDKSLKMHPYN